MALRKNTSEGNERYGKRTEENGTTNQEEQAGTSGGIKGNENSRLNTVKKTREYAMELIARLMKCMEGDKYLSEEIQAVIMGKSPPKYQESESENEEETRLKRKIGEEKKSNEKNIIKGDVKIKKNELINRIPEYDIIVLTETKYNNENSIYCSGYKTISTINRRSSGGVAIIIRNNIEFEQIKGWKNIGEEFDIAGIRLLNTKEQFNIVAIYRRPSGTTVNKRQWKSILEFEKKGLETKKPTATRRNLLLQEENQQDIDQKTAWDKYPEVAEKLYRENKEKRKDMEGKDETGIEMEYQALTDIMRKALEKVSGKKDEKRKRQERTREKERKTNHQPKKWGITNVVKP
ncbi:hypothetical protein PV325_006540 [Microctonus aethiopoides]|nr:hypothetical protein PV325_006540 [Microctonus aethiopoides]